MLAHELRSATPSRRTKALEPLAGHAAGALFTLGVIGVGFLAIPVMTTGAAYDLSQSIRSQSRVRRNPD